MKQFPWFSYEKPRILNPETVPLPFGRGFLRRKDR
jgi:hypothetical protein